MFVPPKWAVYVFVAVAIAASYGMTYRVGVVTERLAQERVQTELQQKHEREMGRLALEKEQAAAALRGRLSNAERSLADARAAQENTNALVSNPVCDLTDDELRYYEELLRAGDAARMSVAGDGQGRETKKPTP